MHLIKPGQISGEIMTLIDEADKKLTIISPYCKVNKWYKFLKKIESARQRRIEIEFYVRKEEIESIQEIKNIGFVPIEIENLHCKIYINEKYAIVSSMNLLLSSEINSLDIAFKTNSKEEYEEIASFYERYIKKSLSKDLLEKGSILSLNERIMSYIAETLRKNWVSVNFVNINQNKLNVVTKYGRYIGYIESKDIKSFKMIAIVSDIEFAYGIHSSKSECFLDRKTKIDFIGDNETNSYKIIGTLTTELKTVTISEIKFQEASLIATTFILFIYAVELLKDITADSTLE